MSVPDHSRRLRHVRGMSGLPPTIAAVRSQAAQKQGHRGLGRRPFRVQCPVDQDREYQLPANSADVAVSLNRVEDQPGKTLPRISQLAAFVYGGHVIVYVAQWCNRRVFERVDRGGCRPGITLEVRRSPRRA